MKLTYLLVIALGIATAACGARPQGLQDGIKREAVSGDAAASHASLVKAGDDAWALRADRAQLELAIQKWDEAIKVKDDDAETYGKLSRACYLLADGWLAFEDENKSAYLAMHERGMAFGQRGMAAVSSDFEKRVLAGTNIEDAVKVLDQRALSHMYWYASNLGKWANASGFQTVLRYKERIFNVISRVYELSPEFFHGAADRYFGAFYAIAPAFAGGDLEKSYAHFTASTKIAPAYLGTYNLIAEFYAPKVQDPQIFDDAINFVLKADVNAIPGLEPEAAIEKKKAERLLAKKNDMF